MFCAAGALPPASAVKESASGRTSSAPGGGGGGGAAVKVMVTGTVTLPTVPASKTMVAVREPAVVWEATDTETLLVAPGASEPDATDSVSLASLEVAFQLRPEPPSLSSVSVCA